MAKSSSSVRWVGGGGGGGAGSKDIRDLWEGQAGSEEGGV